MASAFNLRLVIDDEGGMQVGLNITSNSYLRVARLGTLHEPLTAGSVSSAVASLVRCWLAPELHADADQALEATFEALTTPF